MKKHLLALTASAALLPLLTSLDFSADRVKFSPKEGLVLSKSFEILNEMVLDDMRTLMNGQPPPMDLEMEMSGTTTVKLAVTDEYEKLAEGRPAKLKRTYEELGTSSSMQMTMPMGGGEQSMDSSGSSELSGKTVIFRLDPETNDYSCAFPEDAEGDTALLEDLAEDMDMRELLPTGDVAVDEEWEIDPQAIVALLAPGGNLKIKSEDEDSAQMMGGMSPNMRDMLGEMSGKFTGTFKGFNELDGRKLAVIALKFDVESNNDLTDLMRETIAKQEIPGGSMDVESVDAEVTFKGEGELLFDAAAGHFVSLTMNGESTQIIDTAMNMSIQGQEMKLEQGMDFSATITVSATATAQ